MMSSIDVTTVAEVRGELAGLARLAGLAPEATDRFVVAVNEVLINAIQHGGGTADVTMSVDGDQVVVEVRDRGAGIPADLPTELPPPDQVNGRGLWLARTLCNTMTVHNGPAGATVRLSTAGSGAPAAPSTAR